MKLVEIEWVDSCAVRMGWDDLAEYAKNNEPDAARSAGWLIDENETSVMIAANWCAIADNPKRDKESINDTMVIPRSAIRAIHELRRK